MNNFKKMIFNLLVEYEEKKWLHFLLNKFSNNRIILEPERKTDYVLGDSNFEMPEINPSGQWQDYHPTYETQKGRYFDDFGCISHSLQNAIEFIERFKYEVKSNYSDRYTVVASGTTARGNTQSKVLDSIRVYDGLVSEDDYTGTPDTLPRSEYFKRIPTDITKKGLKWLSNNDLGYKTVYRSPNGFKTALRRGIIWTGGYAWYRKGNKYYSYGRPNHAFIVVGYKEGDYWIAFDSYEKHFKHLDWNYKFYYSKVIGLKKNTELTFKDKLKKRGIEYVMRTEKNKGARGQIYTLQDMEELEKGDKLNKDELQKVMDSWVVKRIEEGKLVPISEVDYNRLDI